MNPLLATGRWLFAVPFGIFGFLHFIGAEGLAEHTMPDFVPAKTLVIYLTGAALIVASIAMLIGKTDRPAALGLAAFLVLSALVIHLPKAMSEPQIGPASVMLFKDLALAGGALIYAHFAAKT